MDAVRFLEERKRMFKNGKPVPDLDVDITYSSEEVVKIVDEWSAAHPRKTRQDVFLEQWPNANLDKYNVLVVCPKDIIGNVPSNDGRGCTCSCPDCRREFWRKAVE